MFPVPVSFAPLGLAWIFRVPMTRMSWDWMPAVVLMFFMQATS